MTGLLASARLLYLLATAVPLAASAQPAAPPAPPPGLVAKPCVGNRCEIKVFVDDCQAAGGIRVDATLMSVNASKPMRWEIVTPGFEFEPARGIEFSDNADGQFRTLNSPRANEFHVQNRKSRNGVFYYHVRVKGCRPLDPWIHNE